ncbi:RIBOSOMAL PROTEIN S15P/S13E [Salix viminalis]|uniref:RIBOSOMAL PROTEIN S15P/S13E n=1 Tax=Salix viminalis TaxID=40686 RepID=A0A9Q0NSG1_SALVM|nr:RIBOSOMAL PROTEIN S15P/S13E [Salix viminalis]
MLCNLKSFGDKLCDFALHFLLQPLIRDSRFSQELWQRARDYNIVVYKGLVPEIPEDLYHLIKKAVVIRKHLEKNKDSKFRLILVESRIHRLARYYKKTKKLAPKSDSSIMFMTRFIGRTLLAAAKSETHATSAAAAAATSGHNPLEDFFEADRSQDEDKPIVYGRSWKASELRLKSWDDLQKVMVCSVKGEKHADDSTADASCPELSISQSRALTQGEEVNVSYQACAHGESHRRGRFQEVC